MAEGSEDSYLYMKSRSKALYECTNSETFPGKMPSSYVPKQASANTKSLPTPNVRPQSLPPAVGQSGSPSNLDDCMAFDLYEQDPDTDFQCEDYNLRRQSSDFRFNFEDMIVLPIRLKKPFTSVTFDTPPSTEVDEFDYADQHVYYSQLITTVNSNSAVHEYGTRKGPLWDCAWEILVPKGLHPSYLTEGEFVKLVLSQGNDTTTWMDIHIPILHRRALQKAAAARQKLTNAGISPFELTQEYLEAFEWMDKIEQDNFVKTMQKLQLQVAFQKQGLSMRIEDIDDFAPKDEEKLIGKSHTKLVDGSCIPRDYSSDSDESYMAEEITLEEFENQFRDNDFKKAPASLGSTPIQNTDQPPTDDNEAFIAKCLGALMGASSTDTDPSKQIFEHSKNSQVLEDSIDVHQVTQIHGNVRLRLAQCPQHEASSPCTHISSHDPPKDPNTRVVFSLQDPPPLSPTRSARPASASHPSDSSSSYGSSLDGSGGSGAYMTKSRSNGGQSQKSSKTEGSGMSGMSGTSAKLGSISKKLGESPKSLKKKLSSVFGTIGRSGKRNV
ncbi:8feac481-a386-4eab-8b4c-c86718993304-CDS [Sclerotinia trifoliorum]|uniref:8feac481-a386-4eab-8b4c-c86718993304-CDS n=1 Tax=Sclerotinia trifoliorum TaxID=28548 RepID=A0A8H2VRF9_9HELO|nr:8feac481-a386-4eab-8b4c-c86718993304-CDS [Sclerotinia trifoliorum]